MEVKLNIPDWLKIPINVLLPAAWLISGTLLLLPDKLLEKFYLLEWCNVQGFTIGLTFIISSCLLAVYLFYYLKKLFSVGTYNLTYKRKTMNKIGKMNDVEKSILIQLYNSPGYTYQLDYNEPIVQGLLARHYIYMGGQQQVTLDAFTNSIPAKFTLQPFVYQTLDYYRPKIERVIEKQKKRVDKTKNVGKKAKLIDELENMRENFNYIYNGGSF